MKFGAFVMTFNRPTVLPDTLNKLLDQTHPPDCIAVIDNGNDTATRQVVADLKRPEIHYHPMPENLGPAGAAAFGLQWLVEQGFEWLYWGDDDDPPPTPTTLEQLLALRDEEGIAATGLSGTLFDWKTGKVQRRQDHELKGILEVDIISGGQQWILHRCVVEQVGLPDARLFFGAEEMEYSLRIRRAGFRMLVDGKLHLEGRQRANRLNFQRPGVMSSRRPIWRQYYSTRNYIFMMQNTFGRPDLARREAGKAVGRAALSWQHGPAYGLKFSRFQLRGIQDGYLNRMGRTVLPSLG